jgi:hypothetical protein
LGELARQKMKQVKLMVAGFLLFTIIFFGMAVSVQAQTNELFTVHGQVFDTGGITPLNDVEVIVTDMNTSDFISNVTSAGGWYSVNLANMGHDTDATHVIEVSATFGGKTDSESFKRGPVSDSPKKVDLTLEIAPSPSPSPSPSPTPPGVGRGGGGGAPRDTDGDGISDIDEMLAGTDWKDPCDPNPECAACLAVRPPAPTPAPAVTPTPTPAVTPTVPPALTPTPAAAAAVVPPVIPWVWIIIAIVAAAIIVSVVYVLRKK